MLFQDEMSVGVIACAGARTDDSDALERGVALPEFCCAYIVTGASNHVAASVASRRGDTGMHCSGQKGRPAS